MHVLFYDRRDDAGNSDIRVYRAESTDGGLTWQNKTVSAPFGVPVLSPNFDPIVAACYMGDYNFVVPNQTKLYTVWGDNRRVITTIGFPAGRPDPDVRFRKIDP